jgi:hypothetical protein
MTRWWLKLRNRHAIEFGRYGGSGLGPHHGLGVGEQISRPYVQTVAPNQMVAGFEVMAILDRNCGNR